MLVESLHVEPFFGSQDSKRIASNDVFLDRVSFDEVFLDDPLKDFLSARMVPSALGIDDGNGTPLTDTQTIRLGSVDSSLLGKI